VFFTQLLLSPSSQFPPPVIFFFVCPELRCLDLFLFISSILFFLFLQLLSLKNGFFFVLISIFSRFVYMTWRSTFVSWRMKTLYVCFVVCSIRSNDFSLYSILDTLFIHVWTFVVTGMDQTQCVICGQGSLVCGGCSNRRLQSIEIAVKDGFEHGVVSSLYYILSFLWCRVFFVCIRAFLSFVLCNVWCSSFGIVNT
jgi:hypothetical protein